MHQLGPHKPEAAVGGECGCLDNQQLPPPLLGGLSPAAVRGGQAGPRLTDSLWGAEPSRPAAVPLGHPPRLPRRPPKGRGHPGAALLQGHHDGQDRCKRVAAAGRREGDTWGGQGSAWAMAAGGGAGNGMGGARRAGGGHGEGGWGCWRREGHRNGAGVGCRTGRGIRDREGSPRAMGGWKGAERAAGDAPGEQG